MPTLDRHDNVFVLDLGDGENRLHPNWIASVNAALDEVQSAGGPRALVTAATGKFYSNGLDLEWLSAHADAGAMFSLADDFRVMRIVERAVNEDAVRATAVEIGQAHVNKASETLATTKARVYTQALALLRDTTNPLD